MTPNGHDPGEGNLRRVGAGGTRYSLKVAYGYRDEGVKILGLDRLQACWLE
jgi:hypothetical protein